MNEPCPHKPQDLYTWMAYNVTPDGTLERTLVVVCKKCHKILKGSAEEAIAKYEGQEGKK